MNLPKIISFFVLSVAIQMNAGTQSIIGQWKTIDDVTGEAKSIIEISEKDNQYAAIVIDLLDPEYLGKNPLCESCKGDKHNQPIRGLEIMWDIKSTGKDSWGKGKIMDPENGKTYGCKLKLESENKLKVRGYLGFAALGRNQFWYRVSDSK